MFLRIWRFITLMFAALNMALAFCHLLQMQPRMKFDGPLWARSREMYRNFGPPVGSAIEGGAFLSTGLLAFLVRRRQPAARWTWAGTFFFVVAQALWWLRIAPVNAKMANWRPESLPQNWRNYRDQWEYTHAIRAVLMLIGFGALLNSILVETPTGEAMVELPDETKSPRPV